MKCFHRWKLFFCCLLTEADLGVRGLERTGDDTDVTDVSAREFCASDLICTTLLATGVSKLNVIDSACNTGASPREELRRTWELVVAGLVFPLTGVTASAVAPRWGVSA